MNVFVMFLARQKKCYNILWLTCSESLKYFTLILYVYLWASAEPLIR